MGHGVSQQSSKIHQRRFCLSSPLSQTDRKVNAAALDWTSSHCDISLLVTITCLVAARRKAQSPLMWHLLGTYFPTRHNMAPSADGVRNNHPVHTFPNDCLLLCSDTDHLLLQCELSLCQKAASRNRPSLLLRSSLRRAHLISSNENVLIFSLLNIFTCTLLSQLRPP